MSVQPPLFDLYPSDFPKDAEHIVPGAFRIADPETSKDAARSIDAASLEGQVYKWLLTHGPAILDEICEGLRMDKVTISPRPAPLERSGYVERTGITRPGKKGRPQTEWRAIINAHFKSEAS